MRYLHLLLLLTSCSLLLGGVWLLESAGTLTPYHNPKVVEQAMLAWPDGTRTSDQASEDYWRVRDAQLTPKFKLEDYGVLLVEGGLLFIAIWLLRSRGLRTISVRWKAGALGVVATGLTVFFYIISLLVDGTRGEYPPWADSIGIPLMGTPILLLLLLFIVAISLWLSRKHYNGRAYIAHAFTRQRRPALVWWMMFGGPLAFCLVEFITIVFTGDWAFFWPITLWTTFFLNFLTAKQQLPL